MDTHIEDVFDEGQCICDHTPEEHDESGCQECECEAGWYEMEVADNE